MSGLIILNCRYRCIKNNTEKLMMYIFFKYEFHINIITNIVIKKGREQGIDNFSEHEYKLTIKK